MRLPLILGTGTILLLAIYALWPGTVHINPALPQPGLFSQPLRENSTLIIPVEVGFSELGSLIEKHFPDGEMLHSGSKQESATLSYEYTVRRWGKSSFEITDGAILVSLPLRIDATGRKDICLGFRVKGKCKGIKTHESGESTAYVDAKALIALVVGDNYQIEIGSNVTQTLANQPHLSMDLFGKAIRFKINIEGEVEKLLEKQESKVTGALDRLLAGQLAKLDLKATLQKHWHSIRSPIKAGHAWISLNPRQVLFKGIHQLSEGRVALGFGFSGPTSVSLTKPEIPAPMPLPPVLPAFAMKADQDDFTLSVPLTSAFADLNKQAQARLSGRTIKKDGHWLNIANIDLTGATIKNAEGENRATLVAAVDFKAGKGTESDDTLLAEGMLYLTFMPSVNRETRTLNIVDVTATTDTLNLMEAAGVSWLNSKFTPEIMAQLSYDYGAQIDIWQPQLNAALKAGIPYKGLTLSGALADVDIGGFYVSGSALEVYLTARGTATARLDALPF